MEHVRSLDTPEAKIWINMFAVSSAQMEFYDKATAQNNTPSKTKQTDPKRSMIQ